VTAALLAAPSGRHHRTTWLNRVTRLAARLRTRRRVALGVLVIDEARFTAWAQRIRKHPVPPAVAAQVRVDALTAVLHHATGPLPAAMRDPGDDPRYPHLTRAWADDTGTFAKITERGT
jgi:hypothetical protein